ncbi:MAG: LacI family transcriptional regulator [Promicromonosporaceae bacterium]|nr:LacI family transcriptional regulator [Promicromonosporaceae bacterium]
MNEEALHEAREQIAGRVTINDVARVAGVSVATVSKVTNGRDGVAVATADRVMEVVRELGYETSIVASSMRSRATHVIGILLAGFDPFAAELLKGISARAIGRGYELLAYSGAIADEHAIGWERRSLSRLGGTLIDGAIMITPSVSTPVASIPVVAIDPHTGSSGSSAVLAGNADGGRVATQHLIDLGHRRIAHISGREDLESAHLREQGYRQALEAAGIAFDPYLIRNGGYRREWSIEPARELLLSPNRPTAFFAANDLSAFGVMQAAKDLDLRVPEDVSVIGFDDIPESAESTPQLTTVAQPLQEMGAAAVDILLAALTDKNHRDQYRELPTHLVVRESTGPVPTQVRSPKGAAWTPSTPY